MNSMIRVTGFVMSMVACATAARADFVNASIKDATGDPVSITTQASSFFDVFVDLDLSGTPLMTAQLLLQASDSDVFKIESVTFGAGWSSDPLDVFDPSGETLNAGNSNTSSDLGSIVTDMGAGVGPGTSTLATVRINVLAGVAPGTYFLTLVDPLYGNILGDSVSPGTAGGGSYAVNVTAIPSPGAALLGVIGMVLVGRKRCAR